MASNDPNPLRLIPSVTDLLEAAEVARAGAALPRPVLLELVQATLADERRAVLEGGRTAEELARRVESGALRRSVVAAVEREGRAGVVGALNATGVVLHTGLGRAPVHAEAARAMARAAGGYCLLEVDREGGERNQRDARLGVLLARLTGAETGIAVNNNAAAVVLALSTFAQGKEAILSRGELVEIGGSFRMPAVMERADVRLCEVGTTNRTRLADYASAIGPATGMLLKVHRSNFRIEGFTEEVEVGELSRLGRERGLPCFYDLGSGLLEAEGVDTPAELADEPKVRAAVAAGADVIGFSGDKLLGGPQAGLLVGPADAIGRLRANPLYRAMRLDKVALAGLETTLSLYLQGRGGEIPARQMLSRRAEEVRLVAERLATALDRLARVRAELVPSIARPGSGSAPQVGIESFAVRTRVDGLSPERFAARLRHGEPPVFARIHEGALLFDPRTLLEGEDAQLLEAVEGALDR